MTASIPTKQEKENGKANEEPPPSTAPVPTKPQGKLRSGGSAPGQPEGKEVDEIKESAVNYTIVCQELMEATSSRAMERQPLYYTERIIIPSWEEVRTALPHIHGANEYWRKQFDLDYDRLNNTGGCYFDIARDMKAFLPHH
jgi:hypothetical protein